VTTIRVEVVSRIACALVGVSPPVDELGLDEWCDRFVAAFSAAVAALSWAPSALSAPASADSVLASAGGEPRVGAPGAVGAVGVARIVVLVGVVLVVVVVVVGVVELVGVVRGAVLDVVVSETNSAAACGSASALS
jgi:hypothetical protein